MQVNVAVQSSDGTAKIVGGVVVRKLGMPGLMEALLPKEESPNQARVESEG
jgi:hypothetical protein